MAKKVFYGADARTRILAGAEALYEAVKVTYGPKGGNVVIGHNYYGPSVTHDGVTVANSIELDDSDITTLGQKVGAELIKQAAGNLNRLAGDGTTTVTILTYHILNEANKLIAAGHNPQEIRRGIEDAATEALELLEKMAIDIDKDSHRIEQIATISAGDAEIGKLLAEVIAKIGKDSTITVEAGQGVKTESEVTEGFSFGTGFASPLFITDQQKQIVELEDPAVIIAQGTTESPVSFERIITELLKKGKREIVVIADELGKEVLPAFILNKMKDTLKVVIVKAPGFGDTRKELLQDIATFTGAKVINGDTSGITFDTVQLQDLGAVKKIIVSRDNTVMITGAGAAEDVNARIAELREQKTDTELAKRNLEVRASALSGSVAVIKVGGATETEINERKDRVDDAVAAVQAALAEGVVIGGGVTLLKLSDRITAKSDGARVFKKALEEPFIQIMDNAGHVGIALKEKMLDRIQEDKYMRADGDTVHGIDIREKNVTFVNLLEAGVVDPKKVTKEVIKNAASIAATAATMGALVVELPEKTIANNA